MPRTPSHPAPIRIWSDGSCSPNPGPGGWGAIIDRAGDREELFGGDTNTTNNLMEMQGAIEALMRTPPGAHVVVTTDSQYLQLGITQWIRAWKRKQWRKSDGKPVLNQAQWQALDALVSERHVAWEWVRGHAGHAENERCDELARMGRKALR